MPSQMTGTLAALALACAPAAGAAEFDFGPYHVSVAADQSQVMTTTDYQIVVANDELVLTRLTAPYEGRLSHSFVADLDRDGSFEVVVTFSHEQGHATGVHLYTWNEYLLEPLAVAPLAPADAVGYRGGDEFAVVDGALVRIFQVHEQRDEVWQPTAAQRRMRYSVAEARWIRED